jgi:hypothetical protein
MKSPIFPCYAATARGRVRDIYQKNHTAQTPLFLKGTERIRQNTDKKTENKNYPESLENSCLMIIISIPFLRPEYPNCHDVNILFS